MTYRYGFKCVFPDQTAVEVEIKDKTETQTLVSWKRAEGLLMRVWVPSPWVTPASWAVDAPPG